MTDQYKTHWIVLTRDGTKAMVVNEIFPESVMLLPLIDCIKPLKFNTRRDCERFIVHMGMIVDDFLYIEKQG